MFSLNHTASTALQELTYSNHAIERALSRKLPMLSSLPPAARLADRDSNGMVYKVGNGSESFYLIVSDENVVVTTFRKQDAAEWQRWMRARQRRRERETRGLMSLYPNERPASGCAGIRARGLSPDKSTFSVS